MDWNTIKNLKKGEILQIVTFSADTDEKEDAYATFEGATETVKGNILKLTDVVIFRESGEILIKKTVALSMTFNVNVCRIDQYRNNAYIDVLAAMAKLKRMSKR